MVRVARLVLVLVSGLGIAIGTPAESQAGVIPWVYDAIFGPVGSMRGGAAYPMAAGYAPYSAGYAPYSAGYAPYSVGYAPAFYGSYSAEYAPVSSVQYASYSSGCSTCNSCNQTAAYSPSAGCDSCGGSGCSTCGSGNCSTGSGCSNCNVNSSPTTSGYGPSSVSGPTPDPNFGGRDEIRRLERKIEELDHREKQTEKFLRNRHTDFEAEPFVPSTYLEEDVPARNKKTSIESDRANPNKDFEPPFSRGRGPAPSTIPDEESRKPNLTIPPKEEENTTIQKSEGTTQIKEAEPQALRLENRVTSRAIAPRERMQIVTKQNQVSVAKSGKNSVKTSEKSGSAEIVRK